MLASLKCKKLSESTNDTISIEQLKDNITSHVQDFKFIEIEPTIKELLLFLTEKEIDDGYRVVVLKIMKIIDIKEKNREQNLIMIFNLIYNISQLIKVIYE